MKKFGKLSRDTWNKLAIEDAEFYILTESSKEGENGTNMSFWREGENSG